MVALSGRRPHMAGPAPILAPVLALALALTTACGPTPDEDLPPVTRNQVTGHWKGDCAGKEAMLDIAEDGTFAVKGFLAHADGVENEPRRIDGTGPWYLFEGVENVTPQTLDLKLNNRVYALRYVRDGNELALSIVVDPDAGLDCNFEKTVRRPAQPTS